MMVHKKFNSSTKNAWFYDEDWQKGEAIAQRDIDTGKIRKLDDVSKYIESILKKKSKPELCHILLHQAILDIQIFVERKKASSLGACR